MSTTTNASEIIELISASDLRAIRKFPEIVTNILIKKSDPSNAEEKFSCFRDLVATGYQPNMHQAISSKVTEVVEGSLLKASGVVKANKALLTPDIMGVVAGFLKPGDIVQEGGQMTSAPAATPRRGSDGKNNGSNSPER